MRLVAYSRTGTLISLVGEARDAMNKIFVIYYKSRFWPEDGRFMKDTILSSMSNSNLSFYKYNIWSKGTVWKSREAFLAYYTCLKDEHTARMMYIIGTAEGYNQCTLIAERYRGLLKNDEYLNAESEVTYGWLAPYTSGNVTTHLYRIIKK